MSSFKGLQLTKGDKGTIAAWTDLTDADLMDGDVTVRVSHSTLNYKDGLAVTGKAPVVRKPGFVVFPYGERQPILYCKPLRICDIELEAGEGVLNIALGDSERWIASKMESGPEDGRRAHVVVKPTEFDLSTNLVITTDRRVYHLGLISTLEEDASYFRSVRFYYPQDTVQRWAINESRLYT